MASATRAAAAALWPILAYILTPQQIASGYGAMNSANNLGLATSPQIISRLRSIPGVSGTRLEYGLAMMCFVAVTLFGAIMVLVLMVVDQLNGGRINQTGKERAAREKVEGRLLALMAEANGKQLTAGERAARRTRGGSRRRRSSRCWGRRRWDELLELRPTVTRRSLRRVDPDAAAGRR